MTTFSEKTGISWISSCFRPPDEAGRIRLHRAAGKLLFCFAGGTIFAAALPPFNLEFLAFFTLLPVLWSCGEYDGKPFSFLCGWCWGLGWSLFAFRFLREIDPVIPWLLAPVISLWAGVWSLMLPPLKKYVLYPVPILLAGEASRTKLAKAGFSAGRLALFAFLAAAAYTLLEWTRSRLFPWNDLSVTQYRNLPLLQIAAFTGSYGVLFLVALGNCVLFAAARKPGCKVLIGYLLLMAAVTGWGALRVREIDRKAAECPAPWKVLAVQGDLSQRRHADNAATVEAMQRYYGLTREGMKTHPEAEAILWPESAVPIPFYSAQDFEKLSRLTPYGVLIQAYQRSVRALAVESGKPLLFGALDFEETLPLNGMSPGATNSAFRMDPDGRIGARYDKMHRVPFGEYIPFRDLLPQALIRYIDMGRDLVPGTNPKYVEFPGNVRAAVSICYEGIFGYHVCEEVRTGANVIVVLSNDAWYPLSSELEQHLANAVTRSVESGLPMVRSGNNGATGVVLPNGRFTQCGPDFNKGAKALLLSVPVLRDAKPGWFCRCGEWFIALLALGWIAGSTAAAAACWQRHLILLRLTRREDPSGAGHAESSKDPGE